MKKCTGNYYGVKFVNDVYEPTKDDVTYLLKNFKHKYCVGDYVLYRESHRKTNSGVIKDLAYSSEKNGGGTIKVYKLNGKWIGEGCIKGMME